MRYFADYQIYHWLKKNYAYESGNSVESFLFPDFGFFIKYGRYEEFSFRSTAFQNDDDGKNICSILLSTYDYFYWKVYSDYRKL